MRALLEEVGLDPDKALALLQDKEAVQHFEEGIREALRKGRCRNLSGFDYRMSSGNVSTFVSRYFCCSPLRDQLEGEPTHQAAVFRCSACGHIC